MPQTPSYPNFHRYRQRAACHHLRQNGNHLVLAATTTDTPPPGRSTHADLLPCIQGLSTEPRFDREADRKIIDLKEYAKDLPPRVSDVQKKP